MAPSSLGVHVTLDRPDGFAAGDPLDEAALTRTPPDAFVLVSRGSDVCARAALFWSRTPLLEGKRTGLIGHFWASDEAATRRLLDEVCAAVAARGAELAIGPINGSTWEKYRFVTWSDGSPPFFLEPTNPEAWPGWWEGAGFRVCASYSSLERSKLGEYESLAARAEPQTPRGMTITGVSADDWESVLRRVWPVVDEAFAAAFLYRSIGEDAFVAEYGSARPLVDPRLCRLAEVDGRVIGFSFAYLDPIERQTGSARRSIVFKTVAARKGQRIGWALLHDMDVQGMAIGATHVIGALMHDATISKAMSGPFSVPRRRYALFARAAG